MAKIDIISGFLGAGKTTLIKKLVNECFQNEKIVIIENEFGEIGIDSGFLKEAGITVTEMNSGCICCSLVGDFSEALKKVINTYNPDRIIIEPSGVGKLSDVINAVKNTVCENLNLNSYTAVVDAKKCKIYHNNFGEFFNNQIESAKTVILSHTNTINEEKLNNSINIIKELNKTALIVTTEWDHLTGAQLLAAIENGNKELEINIHDDHCDCDCHEHHHEHHHHHDDHCDCDSHEHHHEHHHHHDEHCDCDSHEHHHEHHHHHDEHCDCGCHDHHHADDVFTSWGTQSTRIYTIEEIKEMLEKLNENSRYGMILRAKGIVKSTEDSWIHFDFVPGESEVRYGNADVTGKICVIGSQINQTELETLFNQR